MNPRNQSLSKPKPSGNSARPSTSSARPSTSSARPSTSSARPSARPLARPPVREQPVLPPFNYAEKKHGSAGVNCQVQSNFSSLAIKNKIIYHYTIDIKARDVRNDEKDSKFNNRSHLRQQKRNNKIIHGSNYQIFLRLIEENRNVFTTEPAFDCRQNVYSSTEIKFEEGGRMEFQVRIRVPEKKFPQTFDITLFKPNPNEIDFSRLYEPNIRSAERELQALDIIINYGIKRFNLVLDSKSFLRYADIQNLNREDRERINFDLGLLKEARFGHYSAVKCTENGPQLCVDRVASVFNKGGNMLDIIQQFCFDYRNRFRNRDNKLPVRIGPDFRINEDEIAELNKELKGLDFEVIHLENRPKKTIYKITTKTLKELTFPLTNRENNEKREVTVKDYFEGRYQNYCRNNLNGRTELYDNLPCVQVDRFNPKYFPLEVVDICYDQYCRKKLNPDQQGRMTTRCGSQRPEDRFEENRNYLQNIIESSRRCQTDYLVQFGIEVSTTLNNVNGRILANPFLVGGNEKSFEVRNAQWKQEHTSGFKVPFDSTDFNWVIVNFTNVDGRKYNRAPDRAAVDILVETLINAARTNGITLPKPVYRDYNEQIRVANHEIEDLIFKAKTKGGAKLIVLLLPNGTEDLYHRIKFISECQQDIITQCISHSKSRSFGQKAYCGNIILKINSKLGGVNAILMPDCKVGFLKGKNMIMGLDVTHPSRLDRSQNSIASAVATYDSKMVNYHSTSVVQENGYKEIVRLDSIATELFEKFYVRNNFYPEKLIVYRDGVSEGQFNKVISLEIASLKKAFSQINEKNKKDAKNEKAICDPKITYIICQKRHNTRFLPINPRDRLTSGNVRPGLVVDNNIVTNYNDFYLCAHFGALGTSRPTRYIVLLDESDFSGDELHKATYNLSYLFPRCLKAVSVVPPVLYAHLAAKRARSYVSCLNPALHENFGGDVLDNERIESINRQIRVTGKLENRLYFL